MTSKQYTIIYGKDLHTYLSKVDPDLAAKIDPKGINVVYFSMLHNDTDMRALMLIKTLGNPEPLDTAIDFPMPVWHKITQSLLDDGRENSHSSPN